MKNLKTLTILICSLGLSAVVAFAEGTDQDARLQQNAKMKLTNVKTQLHSKTQTLRVIDDADKNITCYVVSTDVTNLNPSVPAQLETAISCVKN